MIGKSRSDNPLEDCFFLGNSLSVLGPCMECGKSSLSVHDFSLFELDYGKNLTRHGDIIEMLSNYFRTETVNARCKNMDCKLYPPKLL